LWQGCVTETVLVHSSGLGCIQKKSPERRTVRGF
jgi:hypothetical protein